MHTPPTSSGSVISWNRWSELGSSSASDAIVTPIVTTYVSNRSAAMPAQSPTLSPTLSAIVAGLRGSSSGMPASTLPTRSAPTSAALVKIPPPRRAKIEISDAPNASATSVSTTTRRSVTDRQIVMAEASAGPRTPIEIASRPRPATSMPVIAPERNAIVRPPCSEVRAASAVRTLALTDTFIPMKPVTPDRIAPTANAAAEIGPRNTPTNIATTTPTIAIVRYCRPRYAFAPSAMAEAISCIFLVAGRGAENLAAGHDAIDDGQQAAQHGDIDDRHR